MPAFSLPSLIPSSSESLSRGFGLRAELAAIVEAVTILVPLCLLDLQRQMMRVLPAIGQLVVVAITALGRGRGSESQHGHEGQGDDEELSHGRSPWRSGVSAGVTPLSASALRSVLVRLRRRARLGGVVAAGRAGGLVVVRLRLGVAAGSGSRREPRGGLGRGRSSRASSSPARRSPRARVVLAAGPLAARIGRAGIAVAWPASSRTGVAGPGARRVRVLGSARRPWPSVPSSRGRGRGGLDGSSPRVERARPAPRCGRGWPVARSCAPAAAWSRPPRHRAAAGRRSFRWSTIAGPEMALPASTATVPAFASVTDAPPPATSSETRSTSDSPRGPSRTRRR